MSESIRPLPLNTGEIARRYAAGESLAGIAAIFGVNPETIRKRLDEAGIPRRPRGGQPGDRVKIDDAAMVTRYLAGESEKTLAAAFGVDRNGIRRRLLRAGVTPRGRSESMYVRMARTSPEERARLASAAHDAVRGKPQSFDFLCKLAAGKEGRTDGSVSPAELRLADMLREAGLTVIHQKAIGPYNADIATGTVAVEILGGSWHRSKKHGRRLRYILDAGWDVIYIWVDGRRHPLTPDAAQYVVAHRKFREANPAAPRCYRIIRGGGQFVAEGSADGDDIPDTLPNTDRPDVAPAEVPLGYCHCGCGRKTRPAAISDAAKGWVKGQPVRYVSGHNAPVGRAAS